MRTRRPYFGHLGSSSSANKSRRHRKRKRRYHVPFGGRKGSSYGPREQGRYAAEFYTTVKTAYSLP